MARQPTALSPHPLGEVADQRCDAVVAFDLTVPGSKPVQLALDGEDRVNAAHGLDR